MLMDQVRGNRVGRLSLLFAMLAAALLSFGITVKAVPLSDWVLATHTYGGFNCQFQGQSDVWNAPVAGLADAFTAISTPSCQNGYRELYSEALTSLNTTVTYYSNWVVYDILTTFGDREDLCEVNSRHRMSKVGVDTSSYIYTHIYGCF